MRIDPGSRSVQGLSTFLAFIGLNVVYILVSLPVVTIGASTSALYEVTMRYSDDERGNLVKDFFPAFVRNGVRASLLALALLGPCAVLAWAALFWSQLTSLVAGVAMVLSIVAAAYLLVAFLFAMALTGRYTNTFRRTLRNALLIPAAEPVRAMGVVLVPVTLVAVALIFPAFWIVVGTIGFSFGAYLTAFLFRGIFARHTPETPLD